MFVFIAFFIASAMYQKQFVDCYHQSWAKFAWQGWWWWWWRNMMLADRNKYTIHCWYTVGITYWHCTCSSHSELKLWKKHNIILGCIILNCILYIVYSQKIKVPWCHFSVSLLNWLNWRFVHVKTLLILFEFYLVLIRLIIQDWSQLCVMFTPDGASSLWDNDLDWSHMAFKVT